jgi:arsenite methyltransferase
MANVLMRMFDAEFGHPRGARGRIGGAIMVQANAEQERWAVRNADLRPGMTVLVVGHGPGVGLILASAAVGPGGHVIGVDPSKTMRQMATRRCAAQIDAGMIELRDGTAEDSGCGPGTVDAVFSVNNAMLWDRAAGFSEFHRVLGPGGRLLLTVHRHVLDFAAEELRRDAAAAGLTEMSFNQRERRFYSPAVELIARRDIAA